MSETAGTIIKLLAAFTSPKACVKYITVAVTLLISWKYLEPVISETQISKEQLSIVLLLLGVGCGSLVGQAISWAGELLWKKYTSKKEATLKKEMELEEAKRKIIEKEEKEKLLLAKIQSSFEHLHIEQKATLRELTLKNKMELEEANSKKIKKEEKEKMILAKIQISFKQLHYEQKVTLRELTLKNKTLDMSKSKNSALEKNGYIQKLVHVRVTDYLTQI